MTHAEHQAWLWAATAPKCATEPEIVACQKCSKLFMANGKEWFCQECVETYTSAELQLQRQNITYWLAHSNEH